MDDNKTYNIAGTSVLNGVKTFRFANNPDSKVNLRTNALKSGGHEQIELILLPKLMTQSEAITYLLTKGIGKGAVVPTRAKDKTAKNALQIAAEQAAQKKIESAAKREAKKAEKLAAQEAARKAAEKVAKKEARTARKAA